MAGEIARYLGAVSILVVGAVHAQQYYGAYFSVVPTIGTLFLLSFIGSGAVGVVLLAPVRRLGRDIGDLILVLAALGAIGIAVGSFASLLVSEYTPLFGFMESGYRLAIVLALAFRRLDDCFSRRLRPDGGARTTSRRLISSTTTEREPLMKQMLSLRLFALGIALGAFAGAALLVAVAHGSTSRAPNGALVALRKTTLGSVLVDARGRTLYLFEKDHNGKSACNTACVKFWPPLTSGAHPRAGTGVHKSLLGVTKRQDGRRQVTYAGHPLYTFVGDQTAGQTKGEGQTNFGAEWYALAATGRTVEPSKPSGGGYGSGGGW